MTKELISIKEGNWVKGSVKKVAAEEWILLSISSDLFYRLKPTANKDEFYLNNGSGQEHFYIINDISLIEEALLFYSETYNRTKMEQNQVQKIIKPNTAAIGCGTVYKNFDYNTPIILQ